MTRNGGVQRRPALAYQFLLGCIVGSIVVGLLLPFAIEPADRTTDRVASSAPGTAGDPLLDERVAGGPDAADLGVAADGTAAGSGPAGLPTTGTTPAAADAPPSRAAGTVGGRQLAATDRGVTSTTIKLGFLLIDVGSLGDIGIAAPGSSPENQQRWIQVMVDDINKRGGVNGRAIEPVYRRFDVLSEDHQRAACLALTEDAQVFAAAGALRVPPSMCFTKEHATPVLVSCCATDEHFADARGQLFTLAPASRQMMLTWVAELDRAGVLDGQKIGVLNEELNDPSEVMLRNSLVPALRRFGHEITHHVHLSADFGVAASQMPVAVQQMRTRGVTTVLLLANGINSMQFVQQADSQGYRPRYGASDWGYMVTDESNEAMPASFDGALGWTAYSEGDISAGRPERPAETACRTQFEKATGRALPREAENAEYSTVMSWCDMVNTLVNGLRAAPEPLTRASFTAALQSMAPFETAAIAGGAFRPGKFGMADLTKHATWSRQCTCWRAAGPYR